MSIYRQLWLAIISLTILAFTGSFAVSVYTARKYIEQQLYMKNVDNASSLALVLSQLPEKDSITMELMISAQFDTGHYQSIVLSDPKHATLVERHYTGTATGAPAWFEQMFPLNADPGVALVQDGWKQFGSITVVSHSKFAYKALWTGFKELIAWFLAAGLIAGVFGTWLLKLLFKPLNKVVEQAHAIQERRFITVPEPRTPELKAVVVAINDMVVRLRAMFADEADRLEHLRRQVNHDPLTDLPNRAYFMTWLAETLKNDETSSGGSVALLRITRLAEINESLGRAQTDALIRDIAKSLKEVVDENDNRIAARLNGSDLALLASGEPKTAELIELLRERIDNVLATHWGRLDDIYHIGGAPYQREEQMGELLAACDKALAIAESRGPNSCHSLETAIEKNQNLSGEAWRTVLEQSLSEGRVSLVRYPVQNAQGQLLHEETAARLQAQPDGPWLTAGEFMPLLQRFKLSSELDLKVLAIALEELDQPELEIAINLSASSITDWNFRNSLAAMLAQAPDKAKRLWLEVPEYGAFRQYDAFKSLSLAVSQFGCKLGIEHFGQHFGEISRLAELGLHYLKVDSSYVRDIANNAGNQEFLAGLCKMTRNVGILVIAEGVQTEQELDALFANGFDGATGQAVTRRIGQ